MRPSIDSPKQKLILVEDDADLRQGLADYLRLYNFAVDEAASGAEFHAALRRGCYDVVIIDVNLPDISGFDLARHMAARGDVGVVVLTARNSRQDRVRGYEIGADLYLTKPVDSEELALAAWNLGLRVRRERESRAPAPPPAGPQRPAEAAPADAGARWVLDRPRQVLLCPGGISLPVSGNEAMFLEIMARHADHRLTRTDILRLYAADDGAADSRRLDVALSRLRAKARAAGVDLPLQIVRSAGIRLVEPIALV